MTLEIAREKQKKTQDEIALLTVNLMDSDYRQAVEGLAYKALIKRISYMQGCIDTKLGIEL